jgi:hypothetical protein
MSWSHQNITLVVTQEDMIDPHGKVELSNFTVPSHYTRVVDQIVFIETMDTDMMVVYKKATE